MIDNSRNLVPSVTPGRPTQRAIFHHKPYKTCSDHKLVYFLVIKPTIDRYPTMALIRSKNWPEVPPVRPSPVQTLATSRQRSSITGRLKVQPYYQVTQQCHRTNGDLVEKALKNKKIPTINSDQFGLYRHIVIDNRGSASSQPKRIKFFAHCETNKQIRNFSA